MQLEIVRITDNFYQLCNVLDNRLLDKLLDMFSDLSTWEQLTETDKSRTLRYQLGLSLQDPIAAEIKDQLQPVIDFAETLVGQSLYQNSPQLWNDTPGYMNEIHKDISPNLVVNCQIYLSNSVDDRIGTCSFIDNEWYSVPYKINHGYIIVSPTDILHGMRYPVVDQRKSLYQSFRTTVVASDIW